VDRDNRSCDRSFLWTRLILRSFKFRHGGSVGGAGQPPYDPGDLLKLYLYGYINRESARRAVLSGRPGAILKLIWLMSGWRLAIGPLPSFRKDNWAALRQRTGNLCLWRESSTWWAVSLCD